MTDDTASPMPGTEAKSGRRLKVRWIVAAVLISLAVLILLPVLAHIPSYLRYRRRHTVARHFEALGGSCVRAPGSPPWLFARLAPHLGERHAELHERLDRISLGDTKVADADLVHLKGLSGLEDNIPHPRERFRGCIHPSLVSFVENEHNEEEQKGEDCSVVRHAGAFFPCGS